MYIYVIYLSQNTLVLWNPSSTVQRMSINSSITNQPLTTEAAEMQMWAISLLVTGVWNPNMSSLNADLKGLKAGTVITCWRHFRWKHISLASQEVWGCPVLHQEKLWCECRHSLTRSHQIQLWEQHRGLFTGMDVVNKSMPVFCNGILSRTLGQHISTFKGPKYKK